MRKNINGYFIALLCLFVTCAFINPQAHAQVEEQIAPKHYNVAIFKDDIVAIKAFEIIQRSLGYQFTYQVYTDFTDIFLSVSEQSSDLTANIIYNEERAKQFQVSSPTNILYMYFFSHGIELKDAKSIATSQYAHFIDDFKLLFPHIEVLEYRSVDEGLAWVEEGKADGVIDTIVRLDYLINEGYVAQSLNALMPIAPVGIAASFKVNHDDLERMAKALQTEEAQKELLNAVSKHIYESTRRALLQESRRLNIDKSQPVKIKLEDLPLFAEHKGNGKIEGMFVDILIEACALLDLVCYFDSEPNESWDHMYNQLKKGEIDILTPMGITLERQRLFYLSSPYYTSRSVIVKRSNYKNNVYRSLPELLVERVGVIKGDFYHILLQKVLPNKDFVFYSDIESEIRGLINNEVDYIILDYADYGLAIQQSNNDLAIQIDDFIDFDYQTQTALAFPRNERGEKLSKLFNLALKTINVNEVISSYNIYPNWSLVLQQQKRVKTITYVCLAILLLVSIFLLYLQHKRSLYDELTKLYNRRAMSKKYKKGLYGQDLIYLDLIGFKGINDTYGHKTGDQVLIDFVKIITEYWSGDAYRIGGDEFILIGAADEEKLTILLNNVSIFDVEINGKIIHLNCSYGIYQAKTHTSLSDAVLRADESMYDNKRAYYDDIELSEERRRE